MHTASSCYWDNSTDGSCTVRYVEEICTVRYRVHIVHLDEMEDALLVLGTNGEKRCTVRYRVHIVHLGGMGDALLVKRRAVRSGT